MGIIVIVAFLYTSMHIEYALTSDLKLKDPNNLFTVFEETKEKNGLHSLSSDSDLTLVTCPEQCNINLTRALAFQVMRSMSKLRPGDTVKTSLFFYLSWDDASRISNFVNSFSDCQSVTQALAEQVASAVNNEDSVFEYQSTSKKSNVLSISEYQKNAVMVIIVFTLIWIMQNSFLKHVSIKKLLGLLTLILFIISFAMEYMHLYQLEVSKREALMSKLGHQLPSHCSQHSITFHDRIEIFFGRKSYEDCEQFFKNFFSDSTYAISPLKVFSSTIQNFFTPFYKTYIDFVEKIIDQSCTGMFSAFRIFFAPLTHISFIILLIAIVFIFCGGHLNFTLFQGLLNWEFSGRSHKVSKTPADYSVNPNPNQTSGPSEFHRGYIHNQHITYHNYGQHSDQHRNYLQHTVSAPNLFGNGVQSHQMDSKKSKNKKAEIDERKQNIKRLANKRKLHLSILN